MEDKWSRDQSDQITSLYSQLKGNYEKEANKKLFGGPQLPYSDAFDTLTGLIEQQNRGQGGLEKKANTNSSGFFPSQRLKYALGLAVVLGMVLGLPPYVP